MSSYVISINARLRWAVFQGVFYDFRLLPNRYLQWLNYTRETADNRLATFTLSPPKTTNV